MKRSIVLSVLVTVAMLFSSCEKEIINLDNGVNVEEEAIADSRNNQNQDYFLVANRGSSTISVFNAKNTNFITEITLPDEGAQPTYLAHSKKNDAIYVGDFANSKVIYYDDDTFDYEGEITIEEGAFHMWINNKVNQLWVNNIVSKTTSVIDLYTNTVIGTIALPTSEIPELTENAVQHDVTISPSGYAAYVTVLDGPETSYVVMYNTYTLEYIKHTDVGGDAHLLPVGKKLYVPSQNASEVSVLNRFNLNELGVIPFNSAHGITKSKKFVFVTGIADNKVGVIKRNTNQVVFEIDTEYNTPHNLAVNKKGKKLFLSHSGATSNKVVFYKVKNNGTLILLSEYESGLNPFGVLNY